MVLEIYGGCPQNVGSISYCDKALWWPPKNMGALVIARRIMVAAEK